jgi:hypothetical protein
MSSVDTAPYWAGCNVVLSVCRDIQYSLIGSALSENVGRVCSYLVWSSYKVSNVELFSMCFAHM